MEDNVHRSQIARLRVFLGIDFTTSDFDAQDHREDRPGDRYEVVLGGFVPGPFVVTAFTRLFTCQASLDPMNRVTTSPHA